GLLATAASAAVAAPPATTAASAPVAAPPATTAASAAITATPATVTAALAATLAAGGRHGHLHPFILRGIVIRSFHDDRLARQPHPAGLVDADDLDRQLVAFLDDVRDLTDAERSELADVHQTVGARHDLDEGAVGFDAPHLAGVDLADLGHLGQALHHLDGALGRRLVGRGDDHLAVVLDLDVAAGLLDDRADRLATGSDDVADLLLVDLQGVEARCELRDVDPRLGDRRLHDVQDVHAAGLRLRQCLLHDLPRHAGDL